MESIPSPPVTNVDFKVKPTDEAERPSPPRVNPTPPVPFRKRTSFLPAKFFSAKRLPQDGIPAAESDEGSAEAKDSVDAVEPIGSETAERLVLPPLPEETPAIPVERMEVQATETPDPLPPSPIPEAVPTPEPAGDAFPSSPVIASEPPAVVPGGLTLLSTPEPAAGVGPRSDEHRAAVQLKFSCEVAALRLTPGFRLGAVQLRALSEVVSLRLVAPGEAGNPLAAAVAFQIVHVEINPDSRRLKALLLKPLNEARDSVIPLSRLQVAEVGLTRGGDHGPSPITVTAAAQTSMAVQLFGTFRLGSIHFTPAFGVATLRLDLAADTVLVRVTPSTRPTAQDLPPSFDLTEAELDAGGRLAGLRLTPAA